MTVVRKSVSPHLGVKGIKNACQLVRRCDGHSRDVRRLWGVRQLSGSVAEVCQVLERHVS